MKIWFETHASSVDNERGIASGHLDVELSDQGRLQAAQLALRYSQRSLSAIYTSDLKRAKQTADIAFPGTVLPKFQEGRLRECDYGTWSGCPVQQLELTRVAFVVKPFPGGESFRDVVHRVQGFLNDISRAHGSILIIGHRASWYAIEHLLRGRDLMNVVRSDWTWQPGWEYDL